MSLSLTFPDSTYTTANKPSVTTLKADLSAIEADVNAHEGDSTIHYLASTLYPVGSVFLSVLATNPTTLLGFGTWARIAEGQMLTGFKTGDSDFGTLEATGGAKTKTIAQANLPNISTGAGTNHAHTGPSHQHTGTTFGQNAQHHHQYESGDGTTSSGYAANTNARGVWQSTADASNDHEHGFITDAAGTGATGGESAHTHSIGGSGTAMNIINPYFVIYCWKRVS